MNTPTPKPIGATASIRWMDETFHPEDAIERHQVYFTFMESDIDCADTFHYFSDVSALEAYMEYPDECFAISNYELVFNQLTYVTINV